MRVTPTTIPDILVIEPRVYGDDRGFFAETFNLKAFEESTGITRSWVQDNHSRSAEGVLRGLHFQRPNPQGKLVRCTYGSIFDVAVDVRRSADTFLEWVGCILTAENHRQLWIPEGFAHGFLVTSTSADVQYKTTEYYSPESDAGIRWDDPTVGIDWPIDRKPILSDKDLNLPPAESAELFT